MGARASAALYAISVLVRLEKSWKAATSDRSARRPRNVLFPEAMLPSTAIIKGREMVVAVDKMVEFFDIDKVEMLEVLVVFVDEEMAVRSQDHKSERSMMIAVTPSTRSED